MHRSILFIAVIVLMMPVYAQTIIPLYKGKVPNSIDTQEPELKKEVEKGNFWYFNVTTPTLEIHLPEKATPLVLL